jgi:hypothetical protein
MGRIMKYVAKLGLFGSVAALLATLAGTPSAFAAVQVSTKPTENMTCSQGVCSPTAKKAVLNVTDLANMLASGDVTVRSGSLAHDIDINAALSWTSTSRLTLDSYRSITFRKPVSITGTGALTITTNDGGSSGDYVFLGKGHVEFWDVVGNYRLVINGREYQLAKSIRQIAKIAKRIVGARIALAKNIGAGNTMYTAAPVHELSGSLEGLGNRISNLTIHSDADGAALGLIGIYSFDSLDDSIRDIALVNVNISGNGFGQQAGALAGGTDGSVLNVFVSGSLALSGTRSSVGALAGSASFPITHAAAGATVSVGPDGSAGGLVGVNYQFGSLIQESFASGNVSGGDGAKVGGLIGDNVGAPVADSYAIGAVSGGNNSFVGGLIGMDEDGNIGPSIARVYSTGAVSGGSGATLGGLLGSDVPDSSISDAYWDLDTSGISNPAQGAGNIANDHGITGLTDAQLKSGLPGGFDPATWGQSADINNGYPYLIANPPPK